jgi:predicted unusual protein kinase regulating ubiquinone biosynthesis (AarF/ABC1/UbiB family)
VGRQFIVFLRWIAMRCVPSSLAQSTEQFELVDFGAMSSYSVAFMDGWFSLLLAAARQDREDCMRWSLELAISLATRAMSAFSIFLSFVVYLTKALDHE